MYKLSIKVNYCMCFLLFQYCPFAQAGTLVADFLFALEESLYLSLEDWQNKHYFFNLLCFIRSRRIGSIIVTSAGKKSSSVEVLNSTKWKESSCFKTDFMFFLQKAIYIVCFLCNASNMVNGARVSRI